MQTEKQRERLVELLNEATFGVNTQTLADHLHKETIERVADYLIANNVVVLPCKVGDNVFFLHYGEICEATVVNVEYNYYTTPKEWITVEYRSQAIGTNRYKTRIDLMWGKTVFLTREEAEEKVKEMRDGT
jgi:hypothetical protein